MARCTGSLRIVEFQFNDKQNMFITIKCRQLNNFRSEKKKSTTLSSKMKSLGCFEEETRKMYLRSPFLFSKIHRSHYVIEENPSSCYIVGKDTLSGFGKCLKSPEGASQSDSAAYEEFTEHCVHCEELFCNQKDEYHHTCKGKLGKGFLCEYCEKLYSSFLKLRSHKQLHFV